MSGAAARLDTPLRTGAGKAGAAPSVRVDENVAGLLRLFVFAAFATFSLAHWLGVLENPPVGRGLLVVLVCTLGGAALWATGLSPVPTRVAQIARPLIVLAMAVLSLLAAGLALHFLFPHGWHRLGPGLNRGLLGAQATIYPYTGATRGCGSRSCSSGRCSSCRPLRSPSGRRRGRAACCVPPRSCC